MPIEDSSQARTLSYQGKSTLQTVFVVSGLKTNPLGMFAITSLTLATRIDSTETGVGQQHYRNMFPNLFKRLGKSGSTLRHSVEGYTIAHIPGKELCVADTLSPAPITAVSNDSELQEEADYLMEVRKY